MDFSVKRGEIHALLGGNGAGKSTLIRIITGTAAKDGGELVFRDAAGNILTETDGRRKVAVVHQELALLPHLTVAENIALPHFRNGSRLFDRRTAASQAHAALSMIDREFAGTALNRLVGDLTLHEGQMVEIARALSSGAELILLDEPTANLTAAETERLFGVLRRLTRENGLSVVFVSHRMKEIRQIAHVCSIIRDGRTVVRSVPTAELTDLAIIEHMGQAHATAAPLPARTAATGSRPGEPLTIAEEGFSVTLKPGTILGVAGAPAGPETLIAALIGAAYEKRWTVARRMARPFPLAARGRAPRSGLRDRRPVAPRHPPFPADHRIQRHVRLLFVCETGLACGFFALRGEARQHLASLPA